MKQPTTTHGLWLREQRQRLGLSQSAVARVLGVSPGTVCNWERRQNHRPSKRLLPKMAQLFGLPVAEVQTGTGHGEGRTHDFEPISLSGRKGCPGCEAYTPCKQAVIQGLPILCETVTEMDVQAAKARGMEQELLASRRL